MIGSAVKKEAAHVMMAEQALLVLRDWLREMKENMPVQNVLQKFQDTIAENTYTQ